MKNFIITTLIGFLCVTFCCESTAQERTYTFGQDINFSSSQAVELNGKVIIGVISQDKHSSGTSVSSRLLSFDLNGVLVEEKVVDTNKLFPYYAIEMVSKGKNNHIYLGYTCWNGHISAASSYIGVYDTSFNTLRQHTFANNSYKSGSYTSFEDDDKLVVAGMILDSNLYGSRICVLSHTLKYHVGFQ